MATQPRWKSVNILAHKCRTICWHIDSCSLALRAIRSFNFWGATEQQKAEEVVGVFAEGRNLEGVKITYFALANGRGIC